MLLFTVNCHIYITVLKKIWNLILCLYFVISCFHEGKICIYSFYKQEIVIFFFILIQISRLCCSWQHGNLPQGEILKACLIVTNGSNTWGKMGRLRDFFILTICLVESALSKPCCWFTYWHVSLSFVPQQQEA